jgi:glutathione S-transferase
MITLHGFAVSNYYNKCKIALLEKGVAFEENLVWTGQSPELLAKSPMGKIPFLETPEGILNESQVILEYIEQANPQNPLLPRDPFAAAKVRELSQFIDLHIELVARRLYPQAFFGGTVSDSTKEGVRKDLTKGIRSLKALVKFSPYIAGNELTLADCSAYVHLPLAAMATKTVLGEDMLADLPLREYATLMRTRASVQKTDADRKANQALMAERMKAK